MFLFTNNTKRVFVQRWGVIKKEYNKWYRFFGYLICNNELYKEHDLFFNIDKKSPDEIIQILKNMIKEKKSDYGLLRCITNHLFEFSDDYFCPQIIQVLESYDKLRYSDETLLGFVSHRISDLTNLKSSLRINTLIHIFKQLNFHHPFIKNPVIEQLNDHIYNYKNELINILKNISYLYIDNTAVTTIMNHIVLNKENYEKPLFILFEAFTRLEIESNEFIDHVFEKVKNVENEKKNFIDCKNCIKFLSGYKRLGLHEETHIHSNFENKINNIKTLQPNNISYIMLLMLSSKWTNSFLLEHLMMHIENFVNNNSNSNNSNSNNSNNNKESPFVETSNVFFSLADVNKEYMSSEGESADEGKVKSKGSYFNPTYLEINGNKKEIITNSEELIDNKRNHTNICNKYILQFLPFHLLLLVLLDYENKNSLIHLSQICVDEYICFYDTSNLIKLIYLTTLLMLHEGGKKRDLEKNIIRLFLNMKNIYKSATINDFKILYDCFLFHENIFKNDKSWHPFYYELLNNECYSILPSSYSNLNFEDFEIIKCGSSTYMKEIKTNTIFVYINKNDFYSTSHYTYDNLLLNVKFKIQLLKKRCANSSNIQIIYNGKHLPFSKKREL